MLRLPDPEDVADADDAGAAAQPPDAVAPPGAADAAGAAVVTDLSERRARNPLFREQPSARRATPDDDRRSARRARRVVTGGVTGPEQSVRHHARRDDADHRDSRGHGARRDDARGAAAPDGDVPVCTACPFGAAMLALDEVQPDARDHLLAASRELLAAARTVIESLEHTIERQQRHPTSSTHRDVQHVRVRRA